MTYHGKLWLNFTSFDGPIVIRAISVHVYATTSPLFNSLLHDGLATAPYCYQTTPKANLNNGILRQVVIHRSFDMSANVLFLRLGMSAKHLNKPYTTANIVVHYTRPLTQAKTPILCFPAYVRASMLVALSKAIISY